MQWKIQPRAAAAGGAGSGSGGTAGTSQAVGQLSRIPRHGPTDDDPDQKRDQGPDVAQVLAGRCAVHGDGARGKISNSSGGRIVVIDHPSARCNGLQSYATTPRSRPRPGMASSGMNGPITSSSRPSGP